MKFALLHRDKHSHTKSLKISHSYPAIFDTKQSSS